MKRMHHAFVSDTALFAIIYFIRWLMMFEFKIQKLIYNPKVYTTLFIYCFNFEAAQGMSNFSGSRVAYLLECKHCQHSSRLLH